MKKLNLSNVQEAGTADKLNAGGYVCRYTNIRDDSNKEYLYMEFDIAEGEHKGYYSSLNERAGFWAGKCYRSYKEAALPMFKRMCSAVTKSNPNFVFDGETNSNEQTLIGKLVGIVLGEEEYEANNGEVKTRLYVAYECDVKNIREGKFKVPAPKLLNKPAPVNNISAITEDFMKVPEGDMDSVPWS